jgi:hypothetical protein
VHKTIISRIILLVEMAVFSLQIIFFIIPRLFTHNSPEPARVGAIHEIALAFLRL